ncbi:MAG: hypothetical protein K2M42_02505 [Oscillospiraceae bacterium]|nr:hypothetical protein [Oscillospiraceae bacterium]
MEERGILNEQLRTVNQSLCYLMLIILSVILSFRSVLIQREQLEETLAGQPAGCWNVYPIRLSASVLVVSALGFFFCLALRTCRDASRGDDPAAQKSAGMNLWASLFVLAAALIRLYDLNFTEEIRCCRAAAGAP